MSVTTKIENVATSTVVVTQLQGPRGIQGPVGPQGSKGDTGDITPELEAARLEASAAALTASNASTSAAASASISTTQAELAAVEAVKADVAASRAEAAQELSELIAQGLATTQDALEVFSFPEGMRKTVPGESFYLFNGEQILRYANGISDGREDPVFALPPTPAPAPAPQLLSPGVRWTGVAGSGFVTTPVDPTRTTAKPALRLLVPHGQRFTDELVVGVAAFANNGGTLIGGIKTVQFHFEGRTIAVSPRFYTFPDSNGNNVTYWGYWVSLKRPAGQSGDARLYVEATPSDPTMQSRVIGPFTYTLAETLHDREYTINPDVAVSSTNFHTFDAAIARVKTDTALNPRITFKKAMNNVESTFAAAAPYSVKNYVTVDSDFPVTFGRTSIGTTATVDSDARIRPRVGKVWFKGENITFDYAYIDTATAEAGENWVLDGINMINSRGFGAIWRGGPYWTFNRVTGSPWFLECQISNLENACMGASLVRGVVVRNATRDIFSEARCIVGTLVERHSDTFWNNDTPVMTVVYSGSEATASVSRVGSPDLNVATYVFKWGANSRTFTAGKSPSAYAAGLVGDSGYTFGHLVTWINTVLAGLDSGWNATLIDTDGWRATSGSLAGRKAQGFGDTNCKGSALTVVSAFDAHGDWYQQRFDGLQENVIAYNNVGFDMQTQHIFLSSTVSARDFIFVNNAFGSDQIGSDYFIPGMFLSQFGRSDQATTMSHVVVAHCSMPDQGLVFRTDGTTNFTTHDGYCLYANNAVQSLRRNTTGLGRVFGGVVKDNHIHSESITIAEAVGTTVGGNGQSLFPNQDVGDFTPAGDLLTSQKPPVLQRDLVNDRRAASAPPGALA